MRCNPFKGRLVLQGLRRALGRLEIKVIKVNKGTFSLE